MHCVQLKPVRFPAYSRSPELSLCKRWRPLDDCGLENLEFDSRGLLYTASNLDVLTGEPILYLSRPGRLVEHFR